MKFVMLGAGGIGAYYAAKLLAAGHDGVIVARGAHLAAMQNDGLEIIHPDFSFHAPVVAMDVETLCREKSCQEFDLIILAVKSGETRPIMTQMSEWLSGSDVPVMSIQNGVLNEAGIAETVGQSRTIGGLAVKIGAHIVQPGVIKATGIAQIDFGAWPCSERNRNLLPFLESLSTCFLAADIPNKLYNHVDYALWRKLVINNGVNPITALTLQNTKVVTTDPVLRNAVYKMMQETARAAKQAGVELSANDVDEMFNLICEFDAIKTSMQVDREKGRPMEIKDICGPVIDYCRQAGEPAEMTELISSLLSHVNK